jgi:hypothetical protein
VKPILAEAAVTVETGFIPSELELMVKQELRKEHEVPDALIIQIIRDRGSWRAEARFKNGSRGLLGDHKIAIAAKVAEIGQQLAPGHQLIG